MSQPHHKLYGDLNIPSNAHLNDSYPLLQSIFGVESSPRTQPHRANRRPLTAMPAIEPTTSQRESTADGELRFPPVKREHILHCSYDYWFPKCAITSNAHCPRTPSSRIIPNRYRTSCIRSRIIPLTQDFVSYIHEDGIILADEGSGGNNNQSDTAASGDEDDDWEPSFTSSSAPAPRPDVEEPETDSDSDDDDDATSATRRRRQPPNLRFPALHASITEAIASLGGAACPKLNWSSPKDATWISRHPNTMKCTSANDVYILLKSSSFISHDLSHAFDDTVPTTSAHGDGAPSDFAPVLVLRSYFKPLPSLEFRCFVKDRSLIAISQRDLNYYAFLKSLRPQIIRRARELFNAKMRFTFPDSCFVFDVYIPEADYDDDDDDDDQEGQNRTTLGRARLIDINPWAPRTDTLLFDWRELLEMRVARPLFGSASDMQQQHDEEGEEEEESGTASSSSDDEEEEEETEPELRLVEEDDPAAYNFSSPQYSAHKLPKEVVDASLGGEGGMREFAQRWQRITERREGS